jgi:hypothetical protein
VVEIVRKLDVLEIRNMVFTEMTGVELLKEDVYICPLHNIMAKGLGLVVGSRSRLEV